MNKVQMFSKYYNCGDPLSFVKRGDLNQTFTDLLTDSLIESAHNSVGYNFTFLNNYSKIIRCINIRRKAVK